MRLRGFALGSLLVLDACAGRRSELLPADLALADEEGFRQVAPSCSTGAEFKVPAIAQWRLPNGIVVYHHERHDLPLVSIAFAVPLPESAMTAQTFLALEALGAGTVLKQQTTELAPQVDGSAPRAERWAPGAAIWQTVLSTSADIALETLSRYVRNPAFHEKTLAVAKLRSLERIRSGRASPLLLRNGLQGFSDQLERVSRDELLATHRQVFVPDGAALVVVGDIQGDRLRRTAELYFGDWTAVAEAATSNTPEPAGTKALLHQIARTKAATRQPKGAKSKAPEAAVQIASEPPTDQILSSNGIKIRVTRTTSQDPWVTVMHAAPLSSDADLLALTLLVNVLESRIVRTLRLDAHAAYTVSAQLDRTRSGVSVLAANAKVSAPAAVDAVRLLSEAMRNLRNQLVTTEEFEAARARYQTQLADRLSSNQDAALWLSWSHLTAAPSLTTYDTRLRAVTVTALRDAADQLLSRESLSAIVAGQLAPDQIEALMRLGDVQVD